MVRRPRSYPRRAALALVETGSASGRSSPTAGSRRHISSAQFRTVLIDRYVSCIEPAQQLTKAPGVRGVAHVRRVSLAMGRCLRNDADPLQVCPQRFHPIRCNKRPHVAVRNAQAPNGRTPGHRLREHDLACRPRRRIHAHAIVVGRELRRGRRRCQQRPVRSPGTGRTTGLRCRRPDVSAHRARDRRGKQDGGS